MPTPAIFLESTLSSRTCKTSNAADSAIHFCLTNYALTDGKRIKSSFVGRAEYAIGLFVSLKMKSSSV